MPRARRVPDFRGRPPVPLCAAQHPPPATPAPAIQHHRPARWSDLPLAAGLCCSPNLCGPCHRACATWHTAQTCMHKMAVLAPRLRAFGTCVGALLRPRKLCVDRTPFALAASRAPRPFWWRRVVTPLPSVHGPCTAYGRVCRWDGEGRVRRANGGRPLASKTKSPPRSPHPPAFARSKFSQQYAYRFVAAW
jgi:hypothetical protein